MFDTISWPIALIILLFILFLVWLFFGKKMGQARLDLNTRERSAIFHILAPGTETTMSGTDHIVTQVTLNPESEPKSMGWGSSKEIDKQTSKEEKGEGKENIKTIVLDNPLPKPKPFPNPRPSQGELKCKEVLEKIFGRPFITVRPDFLKNPKTRRNLELDCYNHDLKLAVEYQGSHHYPPKRPTLESTQKYNYQNELDQLKVQRCQEHGIHLIAVPCTVSLADIEGYIRERLPDHFKTLLSGQ